MPLPPSGPISMQMINVELAYPATQVISLNETAVRALAQVPSGIISLSDFYGKSATVNNGFWLGGYVGSTATYSTAANKIAFSTETFSALSNMPQSRGLSLTASSQSNMILAFGTSVYGFGSPGNLPAAYQNALLFNFASESYSSSPTIPAPTGQYNYPAVTASSDTNTYWSNSNQVSSNVTLSGNYRLNFSTYTLTNVGPSGMPVAMAYRSGKGNPSQGYFFGGFRSPPASRSNTISKLPFSTETMSAIGTTPVFGSSAQMAASPTNVYALAVDNPASNLAGSKVAFATDSVSAISIFQTRQTAAGANSQTFAYFKGGTTPPAGAQRTDYMKLNFSNDATSAIGSITDGATRYQQSGQPRSVGL